MKRKLVEDWMYFFDLNDSIKVVMRKIRKVNQEKLQYTRIVQLAKRAEKQAMKFIKKNIKLDPQLRPKYTSL